MANIATDTQTERNGRTHCHQMRLSVGLIIKSNRKPKQKSTHRMQRRYFFCFSFVLQQNSNVTLYLSSWFKEVT